ncbi:POTRA domain-containing protein [Nostoc flagelliforme]|uniref:POTRA domain-containing protein n=1 Tax=Nostoc flagelliforme TaxID=1306274 RepID=UPI0030CAD933
MATSACLALSAVAQSPPPPGVTIPPTAPDAVEQTIPKPSSPRTLPGETPTLPPKIKLQIPPTPDSPEVTFPSGDRFFIKKVEVRGNTVLDDEITTLTQPYENRSVTFEELLELRSAIVKLYIKNGYISSGAFLPNNQDLSTGIV